MTHAVQHISSSVLYADVSPTDSFVIHNYLDETKTHFSDDRHSALRHHLEGVSEMLTKGVSSLPSIAAQLVAVIHIFEDCSGRIPTSRDWASAIDSRAWMVPRKSVNEIVIACQHKFGDHYRGYERLVRYFTVAPGQDLRLGYLRQHIEGTFEAERRFGVEMPRGPLSAAMADEGGTHVLATRDVAEFVLEQLIQRPDGLIPTVADWLTEMRFQSWMKSRIQTTQSILESLGCDLVRQKVLTEVVKRREECATPRFCLE
jgi:hypothetical protein